jgi:hypothetical protein
VFVRLLEIIVSIVGWRQADDPTSSRALYRRPLES